MARKSLDDSGKIPFALVGVVLIIVSTISFAMVGQVEESGRDISIYNPNRETAEAAAEARNDLGTRAHHMVLQELHELTKERDPDMSTLQPNVEESFEEYINNTYPSKTKNSIIYIDDWSIRIVSDERSTTETNDHFDPQDESVEPLQASPLEEGDHSNRTEYGDGEAPLYGRVMGELDMSVYSEASGHNVTYTKRFHENVYSPTFYLRGQFREFKSESQEPFGEVGKLIRYQLSTITQTRTLLGNASGGYGENEGDIESLLSKEDVEIAVNLGLLLEAVRLYGDYDEEVAEQMGVKTELDKYAQSGTIDAADVYLMHRNINQQDVDAGKVLAQAIYPFGEDFVLDLYELFWGDEIVDPTLSEPVVDWEAMEDKGEDWAEEQVRTWLDTYRDWLDIPEELYAQQDSATIETMEPSGSPYSWECYSTDPPHPVGGRYYVFSRGPNDFSSGTWHMDSEEVPDTIDLIMGDPGNQDMDPDPYVLNFDSDFSSVGSRTIEYYLVEESLISRHDQGRSTPYYDTLEYILKTINRSIRQRSEDVDNEDEKGFMDTMSYDTADTVGTKDFDFEIDPEDDRSMLSNGTDFMINDQDGSIQEGLKEFEDEAGNFDKRDEWWSEGAYKREYDDDFIYHLTRETVDLWYEAVVNLYDGGVERQGNPTSTVSLQTPDEEQRSDGDSSEGSFEFRQDAMEDVNERVREIAVPRRSSFQQSAWQTTIAPPCWSCWRCQEMQLVIIADAQSTWNDQAIWDRLWDNIQDATEQVVGEQGLLADDQISQDLKEDMDDITDVGEYEGERSGEAGYYDFILEHIAVRTIGDGSGGENMVLNLSEENGWLQHKFQQRTVRDIHRNTYVNQEELFLATNLTQPRYNWRVNRTYDKERQRILNESFRVDFSHYLSEDNGLSIDIDYPDSGQHFVDVQGRYSDDSDLETNMSWSSFQTAIEVSIEGSLEVNTTSDRRNTPEGVHRPSWYNGTLILDHNFSLPLHSAQPLESGWLTDDVDYQMTRSYFGLIEDESIQSDRPLKEDAIYISRPMMDLTRAVTDVHSRSTNTMDSLRGHVRGYPHSALSMGSRTSSNLTQLLSTIDDIYYDTYNDTEYFRFIDDQLDLISDESEQKSEFEYPSMGYKVNYDVEDDPFSPVYECNRTEISFELGEQEFSYEGERTGSVDFTVQVDPSQDERIVIEGDINTTYDDFSIDLTYPPDSLSPDKISLYDVESRDFSDIYLPNLGHNYSVDVGLQTRDSDLPTDVEEWIENAAEDKNDSYDGLIRFSKDLIKEMHENPDVFEGTNVEEIGLYFHVKQASDDPDIEQRFIYWTNRTSSQDIIEYSRLLINDMRSIGRSLGGGYPAPSLFRRTDRDMLNNYSFEILGSEGNYTSGNLAWWASTEPSIGVGRKADHFTAELGRAVIDKEDRYEVMGYRVYGTVYYGIDP
ncbi:MAG: hypothetical protein V5A88_05835 [Candidatus Thermoplasmatota archaeon]